MFSHVFIFSLDVSEIKQGDFLGRGEFGEVWEVKAVHVEFDCLCNTCGPGDVELPIENPAALIEVVEATSGDNEKQKKEGCTPVSMSPALNKHKRALSTVSFAPDVKEGTDEQCQQCHGDEHEKRHDAQQKYSSGNDSIVGSSDTPLLALIPSSHHFDDDDQSSLSSADGESATIEDVGATDGETTFLRGYMSTHTTREGIARYAIKRARSDLKSNELEGAVVDLAIEAKFLSTMRHPNIVRMRGTVGTPGTEGFMIIMDRLQITLREKMVLWNSEAKRRNSGLVGKLFGRTSNASIQREQYAEKLLAAYDIARAMRYLHNHM